jgi:pyruvate formate-lyase activating enzyme-like uncharacterized protein
MVTSDKYANARHCIYCHLKEEKRAISQIWITERTVLKLFTIIYFKKYTNSDA